jgi:proteasome assembly chaperone (PAC2) family protein
MADEIRLNKPWLVAVWPGMGQVAISAGYYLMAKLGMHRLAEFSAEELFDVGHVDVKGGLIRTGRLPQSRLFVWNDPSRQRDLIVFIGEAQPPQGKYVFCRRLIESARQLGVERVFTFAAMATQMTLGDDSRVFGAATNEENLIELRKLLAQMEANAEQQSPADEEAIQLESSGDEGIGLEDREHIEQLFDQAGRDRANAYELKRELDRLDLYKEYEDRFLDLFKKPG